MRFQVPQYIDVEDKIIGPLTLKQFLIYLVATIALVPAFIVFDIPLFIIVAVPIVGAAVGFAHVKIYGKSLFVLVRNAFSFIRRGHLFLWQRTKPGKPIMQLAAVEFVLEEYAPKSLRDIARNLETEGNVVQEDVPDPLTQQAEKTTPPPELKEEPRP